MSSQPRSRNVKRVPPREIAVALGVMIPLWALGVALRGRVTMLGIALAAAAALGAVAVWLLRRHGLRPRAGRHVWLALPAAAAHLAVSYVAIPVAEAVVPLVGEQAQGLVLDARGGLPTVAVAAIAAVAIAPLEELFWRGVVQPGLGAGRRPLQAIAVTTAAFAAFHLPTLQLPLIAAAVLGGVVWGWLRERTAGLAAPMLAHAIWTGAMVLVPPT